LHRDVPGGTRECSGVWPRGRLAGGVCPGGSRCGGTRGDLCVVDSPLVANPRVASPPDGAEPPLWYGAPNSDGDALVGRSLTGGAELQERLGRIPVWVRLR
jgi:hypothetical protein